MPKGADKFLRSIATKKREELIARLGAEHVVEFSADGEVDAAGLSGLPGVKATHAEGDSRCLTVTEPHVTIPALLAFLKERGRELTLLTTRHASLEDVFVSLTGRHLRDD
jgi:ABC-2 type transport system ATP-binding protein